MSLPHLTIKSARTRLALTYLMIIMVLSIGFTTVFYHQSVHEAKGNLQRQQVQLRDFLFFTTPEGTQLIQDKQLALFRNNLAKRLIGLNIGMFCLGAAVSYMLARRSLRPLEETLTAQSRFTSDAAHELRTPLTVMRSEIEVALRSKELSNDEVREVFASNLEEISKLDALTSALLRLARGAELVDRSHWQDYRLSDILRAAYERQKVKATDKGVTFTLPKTNLVLRGDPDQLIELFVTLFANAIKYNKKGGSVRVLVKKKDAKVQVNISDTGIGIADVDMPHIFERFYRADQSRNKIKNDGYGLGLPLAESIALAHRGSIQVKSTYGKGSTFSVFLPLTKD